MSVLIKGMKMPKDKPLRIVLNPNGQLFVDHGTTFTEYEAVELPDHGDLIEKDELIEHEVYVPMSGGNLPVIYMSYVKGARAVIPAERE